MPLFPYPFLPSLLQDSVLRSVHFSDSCNALRIDKLSRQFYLRKGILPSRIHEIEIDINYYHYRYSNVVISFGLGDSLCLRARPLSLTSSWFAPESLYGPNRICIRNKKKDRYAHVSSSDFVVDWSLFSVLSKITTCKLLRVKLSPIETKKDENISFMEYLFRENQLLSSLQLVAKLIVCGRDSKAAMGAKELLKDFLHPTVEEELKISKEIVLKERDYREILSKEAFSRAKCLHFSDSLPLAALSIKNPQFYTLRCYSKEKFLEAVQKVYDENFIPISEEAILLISVAKSVIGDLSLTDLLKNVYDAEWIDPKSGVSKKLNNLESVDGESPPMKGNPSSFQAIEEKIMSNRFLFSVSERKATGVEYFRVKSLSLLMIERTCCNGYERQIIVATAQ